MSNYQAESETDRPQNSSQEAFDLVAIAASAGGLNALSTVLSGLPANFPATIVIVQHLDPRHRSLMADILSRRTPLITLLLFFGINLPGIISSVMQSIPTEI